MKQNLISLSLVFLGVCILAGAFIVAGAINNETQAETEPPQVQVNAHTEKQLMSHLELKQYLGITDEQLAKILPQEVDGVTKSSIPYIRIGYEYYFPVKAVDQWLTETEAIVFR
ncbi:hypothetical protein [Halobacillus litoralis]|uniref:hypothetical protein n=1 Tax=Halobacillus litoralis TaxID=45668 RepID=UPI001CFE0B62|nr:hypothetical protein [Halobacillus litoralis]